MKLTWHIMQKDLRKLWPLMALWLLILIFRTVVAYAYIFVPADQSRAYGMLQTIGLLLTFLEIGAGAFLVASLVHTDPVVGNGAWWMTRPISNTRLLAAKVLLGVGLISVPIVVSGAFWLLRGFNGPEFISASERLIVYSVWLGGIAAMVAAGTQRLSQFLAASVGAVLTVAALVLLTSGFGLWRSGVSGSLFESAFVVQCLWTLVLGGVAVTVQYLTRKTGRTWVLYGIGISGSILLLRFWSWDFSSEYRTRTSQASEFEKVSVRAGVASLAPRGEYMDVQKTGASPAIARIQYEVIDGPEEYEFELREVTDGDWAHLSSDGELRQTGLGYPWIDLPLDSKEQQHLGIGAKLTTPVTVAAGVRVADLPVTLNQLRARLTLIARGTRAGPELPLQKGSTASDGATVLKIVQVRTEGPYLHVTMAQVGPVHYEPYEPMQYFSPDRAYTSYYLRDGEGHWIAAASAYSSNSFVANGVSAQTRSVQFRLDENTRPTNEFTLVLRFHRPVGLFERAVKDLEFRLSNTD